MTGLRLPPATAARLAAWTALMAGIAACDGDESLPSDPAALGAVWVRDHGPDTVVLAEHHHAPGILRLCPPLPSEGGLGRFVGNGALTAHDGAFIEPVRRKLAPRKSRSNTSDASEVRQARGALGCHDLCKQCRSRC